MGGTERLGRALHGIRRSIQGRVLHRVAAVLVVWGVLLVPAVGPGGAPTARADDDVGSAGYQAGWNAGTCCGPAARDQVDDEATMQATVDVTKTVVRSNGRV